MLLATALALLITGCAQQTLLFPKQTGSSSTKGKIPIISSFLELGRRKLSMQPKFIVAQKMLLKQRNPANIRKWIARFYYFRHLYSAGKRVCIAHNNCMSCLDMGNSICTASLIYFWVPSSCFCIVISLSPEGEIIPFSGVCQSGEAAYPRRRRWWLHALTTGWHDTATDDDQRQHHHAEHHFQL